MGTKPSNQMQQDRPESGGADRDDTREKNGIAEKDKQRFAEKQAEEKKDDLPRDKK